MNRPAILYAGIDGGGTGCRMRIRDAANTILAEAAGGPANFYQDAEKALSNIKSLIQTTAQKAGVDPSRLHVGLGLAGLVTSIDPATITAEKLGVAQAVPDVDAYIACLGAFGGGDGGIVIAGTGSIGFAIAHGARHIVGGWGMLLGDKGSGAWLGLEAMRRTTMVFDGFVPETELTRHVKNTAGHTMVDVSMWAARAKPRDFAAIAPKVFELAAQGEPVSLSLVHEGAEAIAMLARSLLTKGAERICLLGGLSRLYPDYMDREIAGKLVPPQADALDGAILMARRNVAT